MAVLFWPFDSAGHSFRSLFFHLASFSTVFIMKLLLPTLLLASVALGARVPGANGKITYDGYKAYRIHTGPNEAAVKSKVASLPAVINFNLDTAEHLDVVIPPKEVKAFEALKLDAVVLHEDLGADFREEANFAAYEGTRIPKPTFAGNY